MAAILIALATPFAAVAQPIPVHLADGDTWTMTTVHEREVEGDPTRSFSVTISKKLTWRKTSGDVGQLHQEHVSVAANTGTPSEIAFTQTLEMPIDFAVDESLFPDRILNLDEAREGVRNLIAKAGGNPDGGSWPAETKLKILEASARALVAHDLEMLANSQGLDLTVGHPVEHDGFVDSPIGGPPLHSKGRVTLEAYDKERGIAVVVSSSRVDPDSFDEMGKEMGRQLAPNGPRPPAGAKNPFKILVRNDCRSEIDLRTGLSRLTKCVITNKLSSATETRASTDRWTVTQTPPGKS